MKAYQWAGEDIEGNKLSGEGHSEEDCAARAEAAGAIAHAVSPNASEEDSTAPDPDALLSSPEIEAPREADPDGDSLHHLAQANAKLFGQLNAAKEKIFALVTLIFAWNSEQQALAQAQSQEYAEPPFVALAREASAA